MVKAKGKSKEDDTGKPIRSAPLSQPTVRYSLRNMDTELWRKMQLVKALDGDPAIYITIERAFTMYTTARLAEHKVKPPARKG
jgi:hypothetical protein